MIPFRGNRFEDFFADQGYRALKNCLYNYLLRKRAVRNALQGKIRGLILEVGSGMSPMITDREDTVYTDISWSALRNLRAANGKGNYVVADATQLPFQTGCFANVVASEVIEHIPDDGAAIREMARVIEPSGTAVVTFPHRHFYFACDDRFVHHLRRYELEEMIEKLAEAGLIPFAVRKVLGPLEKATMCLAVVCFTRLRKKRGTTAGSAPPSLWSYAFALLNRIYAVLIHLDAAIMPQALSSVLLIHAVKEAQKNTHP